MTDRQYRLVFIGLGMLLLGVMGLGWALTSATTSDVTRPEIIEGLSPEPDSQVPRQTSIDIDVPVDYRVEIWIDFRGSGDLAANWVRVPEAEVTVIEATGQYSWQPSAQGSLLREWEPGQQRVRIVWDTRVGIPDPGVYEFSFRVG
jgi:hypothetical protein